MTVSELIAKLQTMPQDAPVLIHDEYQPLKQTDTAEAVIIR